MKKINLSELRKMVKSVLKEDAFDDINFDFLDKDEQRKNEIKNQASETFYNSLAKNELVLRDIFRFVKESQSKEEAKKKFQNSQTFNKVEQSMNEIYKIPDIRKELGDNEIFSMLEKTFDMFFDKVYEKSIERINRAG